MNMDWLYRGLSLLVGIFVWSIVILRTTDGRSITWYKPPPSETVTDPRVVSKTNKNLTKGSLNEELSCEFSLTADLSIITVTMAFGPNTLATYAASTVLVDPRFVSRGNATWIPTKLTLIVFNVTTADAGIYVCKVLTAAGTWRREIQVTILDQSSITFISENQTGNDGDLLWLNCSAMGTPPPVRTWTKLSDNRTVDMPFTITGKQDEGGYICTYDNKVGNAATSVVFVTVESYRPFNTYLSTNLTNATAELNETIYLMCSAKANPAAKYRLYKGNESIANITATSQNIGVYATSVSDRVKEVVYKCIPFNSFGDGPTKNVTITLYYPVEATGKGTNPRVAEGAVVSFSCPVDGNPEPNITWYKGRGTSGKPMSVEKVLAVEALRESVCYTCVADNSLGDPVSISQCLIVDPNLTTVSSTTVSGQSTTSAPPPTKQPNTRKQPNTTSAKPDSDDTLWIIIGCATGGVVVLAICVLTWWVHNKRKCRNDAKIHNSDMERHDGEGGHVQVQGVYAESGPPEANGTDSAAEQQIEAEAAIPTYAAVDKSKKSKKQADERPPEYAVVDKSKKKEKQEVAAIPTYAAVDKSKKKKKSHEEVPAVYAEVDKSKKKKKKKIDDKNLYENLDEPKKEKKPGELLYADLGDFQNPSMPTVSTSPQPLPAIKKADPYERTDYADITQFLKGNATLPPNDGNGDTEMKPKRPSKNKIQENDKETPI